MNGTSRRISWMRSRLAEGILENPDKYNEVFRVSGPVHRKVILIGQGCEETLHCLHYAPSANSFKDD